MFFLLVSPLWSIVFHPLRLSPCFENLTSFKLGCFQSHNIYFLPWKTTMRWNAVRFKPWPAHLLHVRRSHYGLREPQPDGSQDVSHRRRPSEGVPAGHDPLPLINLTDSKHLEIILGLLLTTNSCPEFVSSIKMVQHHHLEDLLENTISWT